MRRQHSRYGARAGLVEKAQNGEAEEPHSVLSSARLTACPLEKPPHLMGDCRNTKGRGYDNANLSHSSVRRPNSFISAKWDKNLGWKVLAKSNYYPPTC